MASNTKANGVLGLAELSQLTDSLLADAQANNFAGYDPFDGLNSRLFKWAPALKKGLFGLAWIQLHKRSPLNLRPLCCITKGRNPKGVALFILGMLEDFRRTGNSIYLSQSIELADWLVTQQSDKTQWQHSCWGYHFDWNARAFFVPKGKPNVITTIYVAQALYALSQVLDEPKKALYQSVAFDAANFIVKTLYTECEGRVFFAYIPGETAFVHNASLWGAAWVAVVAAQTGNQQYMDLALQIARQSVNEQAKDGSWVYGSRHHHQFIDGFHTGYNLEALEMIKDAVKTDEFDIPLNDGYSFYVRNFFTDAGVAKYYSTSMYPLDMHSFAQAVFTLLKVGKTKEDFQLCEKVLESALELMYLPEQGRFIYQKTKYMTNRIDYMRWTQAWAYYALAYFNRIKSDKNRF